VLGSDCLPGVLSGVGVIVRGMSVIRRSHAVVVAVAAYTVCPQKQR